MFLVLSAFTSCPISLVAATTASAFSFSVCMLPLPVKFRYLFPRPKFLCYLGYIRGKTRNEGRKILENALVAYWNGDLVDV